MTEAPSITCPKCGRTSYNPNDIKYKYCGHCHQYYVDITDGKTFLLTWDMYGNDLKDTPLWRKILWKLGWRG